jgi:hypothetical protein
MDGTFIKKRLLSLLIVVLVGYALAFLYFFVKFVKALFEIKSHIEFSPALVKEPIIELVMCVLCSSFAYICFRIKKNIFPSQKTPRK